MNEKQVILDLSKKRLIPKPAVSVFNEMLKNECWDNIINRTDVNECFNLFLNTFLFIIESCFPMQYVTNNVFSNHWITAGIKTSCKLNKIYYIMSKKINCNKIKLHYIQCCRMLQKIIRKAKVM